MHEGHMSTRERTAWIAVICTLVIWGYYFTAFLIDAFGLNLDGGTLLTRFIWCMGISFVVMMGLAILGGLVTKKNFDAPPDEMERHIEGYADKAGFRVLETLVPITLIAGLLLSDSIKAAFPADPGGATALIFANGVLLVMVVTELVRETVHIIGFRMSA